jgi:hypothetical protein
MSTVLDIYTRHLLDDARDFILSTFIPPFPFPASSNCIVFQPMAQLPHAISDTHRAIRSGILGPATETMSCKRG